MTEYLGWTMGGQLVSGGESNPPTAQGLAGAGLSGAAGGAVSHGLGNLVGNILPCNWGGNNCFVAGTLVVMGARADSAAAQDTLVREQGGAPAAADDRFFTLVIVTAGFWGWHSERRRRRRAAAEREAQQAAGEHLFGAHDGLPCGDGLQPSDAPRDAAVDSHGWADTVDWAFDRFDEAEGGLAITELTARTLPRTDSQPRAVTVASPSRPKNSQRTATSRRCVPSELEGEAAPRVRGAARAKSPSNRFGVMWLVACLVLASWFGLRPHSPPSATMHRAVAGHMPAARESRRVTKPIDQVRVGERVLADNPLATLEDRLAPEPDERTWRLLKLRMSTPGGDRLNIELLRPLAWINRAGAAAGASIDLDLPELDAAGSAEVLSVGACPTIERGDGQVVTATFTHQAATVIDLTIAGLSEPIGCTPRHRFWSEDRQEFVPADELRTGERLRASDGRTTRLVAASPRAAGEPVYNLEVNGQHVYLVSSAGVLVH
ncbi:MAG: polymorphic toxin-type HINT domain-containing protein, partial [Candidatus Saccharimonadales bacterium]